MEKREEERRGHQNSNIEFGTLVVEWYANNHRDLPWRHRTDAYGIWLSEVMLQQTQVETVKPYYLRFLEVFPTVLALAEAQEEDVFKLWEGLGYYSRARNLHKCAMEIANSHGGIFPECAMELQKLPGIGPYTSGAIASIAFNEKVPAVDGNVMRVFSRYFDLVADISDPKSRKIFEAKVMSVMPDNASYFNQGIMELGATICTPANWKCDLCPLALNCQANILENQAQRPIKTKKQKKTTHQLAVGVVRKDDKWLLIKTEGTGLLSGLWGFPFVEVDQEVMDMSEAIQVELEETYGIYCEPPVLWKKGKHVFTHRVWEMSLYKCNVKSTDLSEVITVRWVNLQELHQLPLSTAFKKFIDLDL